MSLDAMSADVEALLSERNAVGLLAEMYEPEHGHMLGNSTIGLESRPTSRAPSRSR